MRWWLLLPFVAGCGDDGGGPCLTPLALDDRLRLGGDCRVLQPWLGPTSCVAGGVHGRQTRVTVRSDGVELRTWIESVLDSELESGEDRVVGDLLGTGRCEPRHELARAVSINDYRVEITDAGFEVDVLGGSGPADLIVAVDGAIVTLEALGESACGGPLHGVRIVRPQGTEIASGPLLATGWDLGLASAPDGIRIAATVAIRYPTVIGAAGCLSPVFLTLDANGEVVSAETPVAVPPF